MTCLRCPARLALLLILAAPGLQAHDDSYFESHATPNGGQMRMAGPYHLEVLIEAGHLIVFVTDHAGTGLRTVGWWGRAILLTDEGKSEHSLRPWRNNGLRSVESVAAGRDVKLVVSVTPSNAPAAQARFTRLQPLKPTETLGNRRELLP